MRQSVFSLLSFAFCLLLAGCEMGTGESAAMQQARMQARAAIAREPQGDYFIGRRYYNSYYKFWGYLRRPGEPWKQSKLVMLNEKTKLAPDREINQLGVDDNCEYKIWGRFTGETVYEPASNSMYPEFELTRYELIDRNPTTIFPPGSRSGTTEIFKPDPGS